MPTPLLADFLLPYIKFLHGAAYSLHQILEGLGVTSSSFLQRDAAGKITGSYWSADEGMMPTLGALALLVILILPVVATAFYTVGRIKGLLCLIIALCLPGVLNLLGYFPNINYLPTRYVISGTGSLGSETGMIPLLLISLITGWALVVLLYDNLNLSERFRQIYDHFWFPTALVAAVFFVADNGASEDTAGLHELTTEIQQGSDYLLKQIRRYDDYCQANGLSALKSCQWSQYAQSRFTDIARGGHGYFLQFAPDSAADYYAMPNRPISAEDVITIRKEIAAYNDTICPVHYYSQGAWRAAPLSSRCDRTPSEYCAAQPDGPPGVVDPNVNVNTVALSNECFIPRLAAAKAPLARLSALVDQHKQSKNYRWLYFIGIAFVVGGKVALASTKLVAMDTRPLLKRRIVLRAVARLWVGIGGLIKSIIRNVRQVLKRDS